MGVVYDAWDTTLDRRIALKELMFPGGLAPEFQSEMVERFMREARSAAKLSHPNVVQVHDVFAEDGRYFIAMEHLEGASLAEYVDEGTMAPASAIHLLVQILDAVQAAHSAGIVHRDIKPDNIFVLPDGRVKVTDFGVAKLMDGPAQSKVTQIGTVMGTPGYMAPEQVMGVPVDGRADIFSVGVVGYELMSGVSPFMASSTTATLFRIANEEPPPLAAYGIPGNVDAVIRHAMAKDASLRYQTAAEMAEDLRRGTAPSGLAQVAGTGTATLAPATNSNHTTLVVGGVVLAALAIAALVFFVAPGGPPGGSAARPMTAASSQVDVPDVTNMSLAAAESALLSKGLVPKRLAQESDKPADTVLLQDPSGGSTAANGGTVTLTIAVKPAATAAPATTGATTAGVIAGNYRPGWTAVWQSTKSKSLAMAEYNKLIGMGEDAFVIKLDNFTRENGTPMTHGYYAVMYGSYASKAEAQSAVDRLGGTTDSRYVRYTQPE
jgi:septal ring-binding cell division protein DamX